MGKVGSANKKTRRQSQLIMEERRVKVAYYVKQGATQASMAKTLDVSIGTINRDIKALVVRWREEQEELIDAEKTIDLERSKELLFNVYLSAKKGNHQAIATVLKLLDYRAKIMGTYVQPDFIVNTSIYTGPVAVNEVIVEIPQEAQEIIDIEAIEVKRLEE